MNIKKKSMVYQRYMPVLMIALVLVAASASAAYAKVDIDRTRVIDLNKFYEIPMNEVKAGDVMNVEIQVTSGSAVDILLMKSSDFSQYPNAIQQRGAINYVADGSSLGTTSIKYSYKFNENGNYYLVIDNTDLPKGGGSPMNQVDINLKVSVITPATSEQAPATTAQTPATTELPKTSGFEVIFAVIAMIVLVILKNNHL